MGVVDDALADLPGADSECLQHVIDIARQLVPEATGGMSYGMPALKLDGKPLMGVVAAAKHLSVFPYVRGQHAPLMRPSALPLEFDADRIVIREHDH